MKYQFKKTGFTLLETVIYSGLISIIVGFAIFTVYQIIQSQSQLQTKIEIEDEMNFILRKIYWAVTDSKTINQPALGATSTILSIDKNNFSQNPIVFDLNNGSIRISRASSAPTVLNSQNVGVSNLTFEHLRAVGTGPEGIKITISLQFFNDSKTIETTYYLQ